jgi:hypothetical protein
MKQLKVYFSMHEVSGLKRIYFSNLKLEGHALTWLEIFNNTCIPKKDENLKLPLTQLYQRSTHQFFHTVKPLWEISMAPTNMATWSNLLMKNKNLQRD